MRGLYLVFILLILQLVAFEFYGVFYTAVNGIAINFTIDLTNDLLTGFDLQPSQFFVTFHGSNEIFHFKMNLFAFVMLFFIFHFLLNNLPTNTQQTKKNQKTN